MLKKWVPPLPPIDREQGRRFLRALRDVKEGDPDPAVIFQTVDDEKRADPDAHVRYTNVYAGTIVDRAKVLSILNREGAGIFVQVGGGGRGNEHVTTVFAVYVDDDAKIDRAAHPLDLSALPPSMVVKTSPTSNPHKTHYVWLVEKDQPLDEWVPLSVALAQRFDTDVSAVNKLAMCFRVPGFLHCKVGKPRERSELVDCHPERRYTFAQIRSAFLDGAVSDRRIGVSTNGLASTEETIQGEADGAAHTPASLKVQDRLLPWLKAQCVSFTQRPSKPRFIFLNVCPLNPEHTSAVIIVRLSGAIVAKCHHNSCGANRQIWPQFRDAIGGWQAAKGKNKSKTQAEIAIALVRQHAELFRSPGGLAYVFINREAIPIRSRRFRVFIAGLYFEVHGSPIADRTIAGTLETLEALALREGVVRDVALRVGEHDGKIFLDLGDKAVEVTAEGWRVADTSPVPFRRPSKTLPIPEPARGGSLNELRGLLNLPAGEETDRAWILITLFLVAALRPRGPYPALFFNSEQGSGKSTISRFLRNLIDPNQVPIRAEPKEVRDLMIAAENAHLPAFDNLSRLPDWLSDGLCRLSTGGGFGTRQLYSDGEECVFDGQRPVIVNGIPSVATRGDLADRGLFVTLPSIDSAARRTEAELHQRFEQARPRILGALLDAVSCALRRLPGVKFARPPRMADFAHWSLAAAPALGLTEDVIRKALEENAEEGIATALDAAPIATALARYMSSPAAPLEILASAEQLLSNLTADEGDLARQAGWPRGPSSFSAELRRLAPALRTKGLEVTFPPRSHGRRRIRVRRLGVLDFIDAERSGVLDVVDDRPERSSERRS